MATLIDGRKTRETLMPALVERIKKLTWKPTLAIVQVGDRPDSTAFIKAKKSFAAKIGVSEEHIQLSESVSEADLIAKIQELNARGDIHGIIVQLPLPPGIDRDHVIESINPRKDTDALTSYNVKRWQEGVRGALFPATARGIRELLAQYDVILKGKAVTVVGRSALVGKPIASMAAHEGARVAICHRGTANLRSETQKADILIVAAGSPRLITPLHVKSGQTVIDVGITTDATEALVGDVDFKSVEPIVSAISPVPGGVGPMTVLSLFENLIDMCENVPN